MSQPQEEPTIEYVRKDEFERLVFQAFDKHADAIRLATRENEQRIEKLERLTERLDINLDLVKDKIGFLAQSSKRVEDSMAEIRKEQGEIRIGQQEAARTAEGYRQSDNDLRQRLAESVNPIHDYIYGKGNAPAPLEVRFTAMQAQIDSVQQDLKPMLEWVDDMRKIQSALSSFFLGRRGAILAGLVLASFLQLFSNIDLVALLSHILNQ